MKNENEQKQQVETLAIQDAELDQITASLPVRTRLRAGAVAACCSRCCNGQ